MLFPTIGADAPWSIIFTQGSIYGFVLFQAANMIGDGADLLLLIHSYAPYVGSLVIPILGAVPDGMMVLCSGCGANPQKELHTGIGALAGSTIMLITWPWFLAVCSGRVNIEKGVCTYKRPENAEGNWAKLSPGNALLGTGVALGAGVKKNAMIMLGTATTFLLIQGPALQFDNKSIAVESRSEEQTEAHMEHAWAILGLFMCCAWFLAYLETSLKDHASDDVLQGVLVNKTVDAIKGGIVTIRGLMSSIDKNTWAALYKTSCGELDEALVGRKAGAELGHLRNALAYFFSYYDASGDGTISYDEFRMLITDLNENLDEETQRKIFSETDKDHNDNLDFKEFLDLIIKFSNKPIKTNKMKAATLPKKPRHPTTMLPPSSPESNSDDAKDQEQEADAEEMPEDLADLSPQEQQRRLTTRAFTKLFVGTVLVLIFTDPMCDLLTVMADKLGISSFYVSFVLAPLAANASELLASLKLASKKTKASIDMALCTLEGAAIMNNTFCLGIFMVLIICHDLMWKFTAETLTILFVELMVFLSVYLCKKQTLLTATFVILLYPLSLGFTVLLEWAGLD